MVAIPEELRPFVDDFSQFDKGNTHMHGEKYFIIDLAALAILILERRLDHEPNHSKQKVRIFMNLWLLSVFSCFW